MVKRELKFWKLARLNTTNEEQCGTITQSSRDGEALIREGSSRALTERPGTRTSTRIAKILEAKNAVKEEVRHRCRQSEDSTSEQACDVRII